MRVLFNQNDRELCGKMAWAYANLTNSSDEILMKEMIDENTLKMIVKNLSSSDLTIKVPCLRAVGNILCGPSNVTKV